LFNRQPNERIRNMSIKRTYLLSIVGLVLAIACAFLLVPRSKLNPLPLPSEYSDTEFWRIVNDFSEAGGFFRSDNFVSNETSFQHVIPELRRKTKPDGVYIGVGPDQNFTYIVALKPKLAFIVDIRRQNLLLHLLYKSIIERSENRAAFLSQLFCRPIPPNLAADSTPQLLLTAFDKVEASKDLFEKNYDAVINHLRADHQFPLEYADAKSIEYVYRAFLTAGPDIRYSFPNQYGYRRFPSYEDLMTETDMMGQNHSYLATEQNFAVLKQLEIENRIIPLVGDFAGDKALRRVGQYLKDHGTTVTAFYTSNVEYYLFQTEQWRNFFGNVRELPLDNNSTFIRAYFSGVRVPQQTGGARPVTLLDGMLDLVDAFGDGAIRNYEDVIQRSPVNIN
jgi:hypothetical protein